MKKLLPVILVLLTVGVCRCAAALTPSPVPTLTPEPDPSAETPSATPFPPPDPTPEPEQAAEKKAGALIEMPLEDNYTKAQWGVTTFRGDAFRRNAALGTVPNGTDRMEVLWEKTIPLGNGEQLFPWTSQPLIVKWSVQVREKTSFSATYTPGTAMREVIVVQADGTVRFLDLITGEESRNPLETRCRFSGAAAVHAAGLPFLTVCQTEGEGPVGLRQYNLYDLSELPAVDGLDMTLGPDVCGNGAFLSAPIIDRMTDTLVTAGTNGFVYKIQLNHRFDYKEGTLSIDPVVTAARRKSDTLAPDDPRTGYAAPAAALASFIYCADLDGNLRCVESGTMSSVWETNLGDAVYSAPALDIQESRVAVYAATTLTNREEGTAAVACLNALTGREYWRREFKVKKDSELRPESGGFISSPVIGNNSLDSMVYYTVTGLTREQRKNLNLTGVEFSALMAMDKQSGRIAWVRGMDDYCFSSPVAVYDGEGKGMIVQCASDGRIYLLDGTDGTLVSSLRVDGAIDASPSVYRDMLVVASTGENSAHIYGICLYSEAEGNTRKPGAEETPAQTPYVMPGPCETETPD